MSSANAITLLRATARSAKRILAIVILYVRPSVTTRYESRDSSSHRMLAYVVSTSFLWANFVPLGDEIPLKRGHQTGLPPKKLLFHRY